MAVAPLASIAGRTVEAVSTKARDGVDLSGWLVRADTGSTRCVVLAAGIRANRQAMVARASWHLQRGWSTLLVDLRGTGESAPVRITMGWHEALDLIAWAAFARAHGFDEVGVHGQSLGAAAAVYTAVRGDAQWQFALLESCYVDIHEALTARLPFLPAFLLWPLVACSQVLIDANAADLVPERAIAALRAPTLLLQGQRDSKVGERALERLFAASGAARKATCLVPRAGHDDLWGHGDRAQAAIAAFLLAR